MGLRRRRHGGGGGGGENEEHGGGAQTLPQKGFRSRGAISHSFSPPQNLLQSSFMKTLINEKIVQ